MKVESWARRALMGGALVLAGAGCAKPAQSRGPRAAAPPTEGASQASQAAPKGCKLEVTPEETTLLCLPQLFLLRLPIDGWAFVRPDEGPTLKGELTTDGGQFIVSVLALPKPDNYLAEVFLEERYQEARKSSESSGFSLRKPVFKAGRRTERMTMAYEVTGPDLEQAGARSQHAWTSVMAADGSVLLYHVSWTGPTSRWSTQLENSLDAMVDSIYVLDDKGQELKPR
jgi:hypothetical protein